jgi:predicted nucleic acid-binding protein
LKVLVDTSVWSLFLRRPQLFKDNHVGELRLLIEEMRIQMIGPIRQELLSGIKSFEQFSKLKLHLASFPDLPIQSDDYEKAAEFFNICRSNGIQGSNTDFLICAISANYMIPVLTIDHDFVHFRKYLPIVLYELRENGN